jgi:D-alanyl-D-alanine endopeptidase (penicillin-binding protein 7)
MRVTIGGRWVTGVRFAAALGLLMALAMPEPVAAAQLASKRPPGAERTSVKATAARTKTSAKPTRSAASRKKVVRKRIRKAAPSRPSWGQLAGLRETADPLGLGSSVALVVDQETDEILFSKNPDAVLPIASITKLMTALVVLDAGQPLDEELTITRGDVDTHKGSSSRLHVGARLTRGEMLHLALMSSENRAAHALGRHYPGGLRAFVSAMNAKASLLGMGDTRFADPTGLLSANRSTAQDLARLVRAASEVPLIGELSTALETAVDVGARPLQYRNSNALVRDPDWQIGVQKTGYIREAGRCVVLQAELAGRKLIMVLLDAAGSYVRYADAQRLHDWIAAAGTSPGATLR